MKIEKLHELIASGNSLEQISSMYDIPLRRLKAMVARKGSAPDHALANQHPTRRTNCVHQQALTDLELLMANTAVIEAADALNTALTLRYGENWLAMLAYMYHRHVDPGMTPNRFQHVMDRGLRR
jgi:hypothetical protein